MNNIEKIQAMLNGTHRKIQVGSEPKTIHQRKEGERWTDGNGREWIKINGQIGAFRNGSRLSCPSHIRQLDSAVGIK